MKVKEINRNDCVVGKVKNLCSYLWPVYVNEKIPDRFHPEEGFRCRKQISSKPYETLQTFQSVRQAY